MIDQNHFEKIDNPQYIFKPQPGPQTKFLRSSADICIYGGAAGGGKTFALLIESLRHHLKKNARMAIFRRDRNRMTNPGGIWDESQKVFPHFGGFSNSQSLKWTFPSGSTVSLHGLQYEQDVKKFHGAQIMLVMFDELTEFTEYQFFYMLSRNRSDSGVDGYVRATCNPDCKSWVRQLISWWIDGEGFPIVSRSGVVRWFCRVNDTILWGDSKKELIEKYKVLDIDCKSFTFIPATIEDNQILLQSDPRYISNLRALPEVEKQQLLFGNWNIKSDGKIFKQQDFMVFIRAPANYTVKMIFVDTAQKTKESSDYCVMQAWVKSNNGIYLVDQVRGKFSYPDMKQMFKAFCSKHADAKDIFVEDAVSGTALIQEARREMQRQINAIIRTKDKYTRAYDCQGYVQGGYVFLNCVSDYYTDFISEVTSFNADGSHDHDDQVDCMMDAIQKMLIEPQKDYQRDNGSTVSFSTPIC